MNNPENPYSPENIPEQKFIPPAVESFLDPESIESMWPKEISENEDFKEQIESHKELHEAVSIIDSKLPIEGTSMEEALDESLITEEEVKDFCDNLSDFFESEPTNKRLALYLPFELLPQIRETDSKELQESTERFKTSYMEAWNYLLSFHDVRANFIDGDVLETELRTEDLPRVVKAAHLIPKLVERNYMSVNDVITLLENSDDTLLKDGVADALAVMGDLSLLTQEDLKEMESSSDKYTQNIARIMGTEKQTEEELPPIPDEQPLTFSLIQKEIQTVYDNAYKAPPSGSTEGRISWLQQTAKEKAVETVSSSIAEHIISDTFEQNAVSGILSSTDKTIQTAYIEGIRKAIEIEVRIGTESVESVYGRYRETLHKLWTENPEHETYDALVKMFVHLNDLKIISPEEINELGITLPSLDGSFSNNLENMNDSLEHFNTLQDALENDPLLKEHIYPVTIVFGSQLKGYGTKLADVDVAVFVKPNTDHQLEQELNDRLSEVCNHEKIGGKVVTFWLDEDKDSLKVHDFSGSDVHHGRSTWTHILFGAAWSGNQETINELHQRMLAPYFYDSNEEHDGKKVRDIHLEELERDALQYRLMHKGYDRYRAPRGRIRTPHSDSIDGESAFWDPGYRRVSSKLFIEHVFLPKIKKEKGPAD